MATRFEIILNGANPVSLRAAGEEALDEIDRLENQLSLFRPTSEIAHLNARADREPVRVSPEVFALLERALQLNQETDGAFDITVAPLMTLWGFRNEKPPPTQSEIEETLVRVGAAHVILRRENFTVRFAKPGVNLDLGAIGKGYAIERAVELLKEAGVVSALIHGGTSTVYGMGKGPNDNPWRVSIEDSLKRSAEAAGLAWAPDAQNDWDFELEDKALSVSAVWGRAYEHEGKLLGHVIDPRIGRPVSETLLAALTCPSATDTDALSTALLTLGPEAQEKIVRLHPGSHTLVATKAGETLRVTSR